MCNDRNGADTGPFMAILVALELLGKAEVHSGPESVSSSDDDNINLV
jgi:hypothetical protein